MKHLGDLIVTKENQKTFKKLTEVSGSFYVQEGATFTAPALTKSGSVYVRQGATFTAPALTEVSGYVDVQEGATFTAPALTKSGYVDVRQGATFTAPALTEVSVSVYVRQGATFTAPALQISNNKAKFNKNEFDIVYFDGIMFLVDSVKTSKGIKIYSGFSKIKIVENAVVTISGFIAQKDNFTAHGETLKKAIEDLNFKIVSEKLKKEPINENTLITVNYYRLITGSCDQGVRDFMQRNNIEFEVINDRTVEKNPITAKELLPILEKTNAYGLDIFKSLINF